MYCLDSLLRCNSHGLVVFLGVPNLARVYIIIMLKETKFIRRGELNHLLLIGMLVERGAVMTFGELYDEIRHGGNVLVLFLWNDENYI